MKPIYLLICLLLVSACSPAAEPTPSLAPSPTASATATEAPTPTETEIPPSAVCTPLQDHNLVELSQYITQRLILPLGENKETGHHGVDFAYYRRGGVGGHVEGTPIQSVLDGVVAGRGYATVYGNYIIIETPYARLPLAAIADYQLQAGQSLYLLYAHMQADAPFSIGDPVLCGVSSVWWAAVASFPPTRICIWRRALAPPARPSAR